MDWMAWTWQTTAFFMAVGLGLAAMTCMEILRPTKVRRGFLPIPTTRGDRFFISLLGAGCIHVAWLAATDLWMLWATALSIGWGVMVMRRG